MKVKYYDLKNKRVFISGGGSGIGEHARGEQGGSA